MYGDSAYHSKELKAQAEARGLQFNVNKRGTKPSPAERVQKARNQHFLRLRAIGEHPYLVVKHLWGHAKVR